MAKKMSSEFTSIKDKMQKLAEADAKAKEQAKERAAKKKELLYRHKQSLCMRQM